MIDGCWLLARALSHAITRSLTLTRRLADSQGTRRMDDDKIHDDDTVIEYGDRSVRRRVRLSLARSLSMSDLVRSMSIYLSWCGTEY